MNKIIFTTIIIIFFSFLSQAQRFEVTSFKQDPADPSANMYAVRHFNGEYCALIKVLTNADNLSFETTPDLQKFEKKKPGEFWVYVSPGIKRIIIRKDGFIPKEYTFASDIKIQSKLTYVMELEANIQDPDDEPQPEFVVINSTPEGASVYFKNPINDEFEYKGVTPLSTPLLEGKYEYKIEKEMYVEHIATIDVKAGNTVTENITLTPNFGSLRITSTPEINATILLNGISTGKTTPHTINPIAVGEQKITLQKELYENATSTINIAQGDKKDLNLTLKPLFGKLYITSEPETGADILVNGRAINQKTPYTYDKIPLGEYTLSIQKDMYEPAREQVNIQSGDDKTIKLTMNPAFGNLRVKATPADAEIFIDGKKETTGTYSSRIMHGLHVVEVKKDRYHTDKQTITIEKGKTHEIDINLKAITGIISVNTTPIGAEIYLDGKTQGNSPKFLRDVQIGTYSLSLKKQGYGDVTKQITVTENKTTEVNETLPAGEKITITTNPGGAEIYINGTGYGITPYTGTLNYGTHQIKLINGKKTVNESITVRQGGKSSWEFDVAEFGGDFTETAKGLNMQFVAVKGGTFTMGCTSEQNDCGNDEKHTHKVTVSNFYMGKYEVTQAQWRAVMGNNPSRFSGCDNCPVEKVSWNDIQEFIKKLNQTTGKKYRLPTEAEWEYAARGGNGVGTIHESSLQTQYAGSNNINEVAWYYGNSGSKTHPVGQKKPNKLGIYDMTGNVWEWCSDWYGRDYYSNSPQNNPQGPATGSNRVLRGGSWSYFAKICRVAFRYDYFPDLSSCYYGFRLVLLQ